MLALGIPAGGPQVGQELRLDVGHVRHVELLHPAEADHAGGHPVGHRDDVAADRLAGGELVAHLGEELGVVVDVGVVGDRDPGLLLELLERRDHRLALAVDLLGLDVDVLRPVGEVDDLLGVRHVLRRLGGGAGALGGGTASLGPARCQRRDAEPGSAQHQRPAGQQPARQGGAERGGDLVVHEGSPGAGAGGGLRRCAVVISSRCSP